jgi:hypothetical protein
MQTLATNGSLTTAVNLKRLVESSIKDTKDFGLLCERLLAMCEALSAEKASCRIFRLSGCKLFVRIEAKR